jgi:spore coat protein U-like protein
MLLSKRTKVLLASTPLFFLASTPSQAADVKDAMVVDADYEPITKVVKVCKISVENLHFGKISLQEEKAKAKITSECSKGAKYTLSMNAGRNSDGLPRQLRHEETKDATINYELWYGEIKIEVNEPFTNDIIGTGLPQTITIDGKISAEQTKEAKPKGKYLDTVQVTLTY